MTNPRVTIVVPVKAFNENLAECIGHCLELDYQDFELLILPDNPTQLNYPKTKVVPTGAVGPAEKRDLSLKYANGEILAFLELPKYPFWGVQPLHPTAIIFTKKLQLRFLNLELGRVVLAHVIYQ